MTFERGAQNHLSTLSAIQYESVHVSLSSKTLQHNSFCVCVLAQMFEPPPLPRKRPVDMWEGLNTWMLLYMGSEIKQRCDILRHALITSENRSTAVHSLHKLSVTQIY